MAVEIRVSRPVAIFLLKYGLIDSKKAELTCRGFDGSRGWVGLIPSDWSTIESNEELKSFGLCLWQDVEPIEPD